MKTKTMMRNRFPIRVIVLTSVCVATVVRGQAYDLFLHTFDGGGGASVGGEFTLTGTIGQPDAGPNAVPMTGSVFELTGGFWQAPSVTCLCLGDMNADGFRNGRDVHQFVQCIIAGGACACANVDGAPGLTDADVAMFVSDLLAGNACP